MTERDLIQAADLRNLVTRRDVLRGALAGGALLSTGGLLAACGSSSSGTKSGTPATGKIPQGGQIRVAAAGASSAAVVDAHVPPTAPELAAARLIFDPLGHRTPDFSEVEMLVAESIEPEDSSVKAWIIKLRDGVEFHDGKPVKAADVVYTILRIIDPKNPKNGAGNLLYVDPKGVTAVDDSTVRVALQSPSVTFKDDICQYNCGIVPAGYDPKKGKPVGAGPFMFESGSPAKGLLLKKFPNYHQQGRPHIDSLRLTGIADETARVNALLSGQVDAIEGLPAAQVTQVKGRSNLHVLEAETGSFQNFYMRSDQKPFNDVRVRQAFRLIADRDQLVEQALSGHGRVANDLFAPFDKSLDSSLPQRKQDIEQAKSLLKQAGQEKLTVELTTAPVYAGIVPMSEVFAQQAATAGVTVKVRKVDGATLFGENYLNWTMSNDYFNTRTYLQQAQMMELPKSNFNGGHFNDPEFTKLIKQALATVDDAKRAEIVHEAQKIEHDRGSLLIPYFYNQLDAHSTKVVGLKPSRMGQAFGNWDFKDAGITT